MWSDRDLEEEQYIPDHLLSHLATKQRGLIENNGGMDAGSGGSHHQSGLDSGGHHHGGLDGGHHHSGGQLNNHHILHHQHHLGGGEYGGGGGIRGNGVDMMEPMLAHLGDQETMLMHSPLSPLRQDTHNHEEIKLPTRKEKESILKRYAKKLGLNDRGCYLAIGLAIITFFLLIIIVAMVISWPASHLRYNGPLEFCSSSACLDAASNIISSLNSSLQPCQDMYEYACGGWEATARIPESRSSWGIVQEMAARAAREQTRIVAMFSHQPSQYNSIEWKVQHFYESCKTLEYIEADREKPLMKIINNLGGWDVLRSFNLYNWDPHRVLRELHAEFMVDAFFTIDVVFDHHRPGQNIMRVSPGGLGLQDKTYYQRFPNDSSVQAYQTFMKDAAQLFGAPSPEAHKFAVDMFNFEKRIAEITPNLQYMADPIKTTNRMKVKELRTMSINIPWLDVLKACFPNAKITEDTAIIVVSPQYAADIAVIMSTTDRASLNNYLIWRLVFKYMPFLSSAYTEVVDLYRKVRTGAQKPLERWEFCADVSRQYFGHLLDYLLFKEQELSEERSGVVQRMFARLRDSIGNKVSTSRAYDYFSRQAAIDKLHAMSIQIGTPDIIRDRKFLKILYKDLLVQKTDFFQNIQYGMHFLRKRQEHALISPGEETRWLAALLADRVNYVPAANKVVVPEYLLSAPLFHPRYPPQVNLGGLGVMIAEAVVEAVAGTGLVFTATGQILDGQPELNAHNRGGNTNNNSTLIPLSGRSIDPSAVLVRPAGCLMAKWAAMRLDTPDQLERTALRGAVSVAAMEAAYAALSETLTESGGQLLPALEWLDPQAVFFAQYAQTFCSVSTLQQRDLDRTVGPELLGREKLTGVLSQSAEFRHFFFCPERSENMCGPLL